MLHVDIRAGVPHTSDKPENTTLQHTNTQHCLLIINLLSSIFYARSVRQYACVLAQVNEHLQLDGRGVKGVACGLRWLEAREAFLGHLEQ
jgi:hypothetical protein